MRPNPVEIDVSGDLGGQKIYMQIDKHSLAHIMSIMTNLYSDTELAIIREYSTNARDSHIEAGISLPIEVYTPSRLSPYFRVKDYGVGMDIGDIERTYSQYGASTKRNTDAQTGSLGLGCKSALAYTSQFMLTSIKNGVEYKVSVSRCDDGTGMMEVVSEKPTNDANGVEISIPVKSTNSLETKAAGFFLYWQPGTVLLNGSEPEHFVGDQIAPNIYVVPRGNKNRYQHADVIVMGGVPYPAEDRLYVMNNYRREFDVVAYVEMGSVNFTPSREALEFTSRTNATIKKVAADVTKNLTAVAKADVDSAPNHYEAYERALKWWKMVGSRQAIQFTYQGVSMPDVLRRHHYIYEPSQHRYNGRRNQSYNESRLSVSELNKGEMTIIYNLPDYSKVTAYIKDKAVAWANDNNRPRKFIFVQDKIDSVWLKPDCQVDYLTDIKPIKLNVASKTQRIRSKYRVFTDSWWSESDSFDTTKPIIYGGPTEGFGQYQTHAADIINQYMNCNVTIISIGANRWNKLKREFPQARHYREWAAEQVSNAKKNLTDSDLISLNLNRRAKRIADLLDPDKIDDPILSNTIRKIRAAGTPSATMKEWERVVSFGHRLRTHNCFTPPAKENYDESMLKDYPLALMAFDTGMPVAKNHIYLYMNHIYSLKENTNAV